jgi:putative drug exporter of the RND superfamily
VLALWIGLLVGLSPLAGKFGDVRDTDPATWLPVEAESTQVVQAQEQFQDNETLLAVVVYERSTGITQADRAKAQADAATLPRSLGRMECTWRGSSRCGKPASTNGA